jgi:hypothetical protein
MLFDEYDATIKSEMTVCVCDENVLDDVELSLPIVLIVGFVSEEKVIPRTFNSAT